MPDKQFHELLGDDGEFLDPVDDRYGVYSIHRHGYWWRLSAVAGSFAGCAVIAVFLWYL